jgi:glutaredoxin 3
MNFAVYTRPGCPYCDRIKEVLASKKLNYREYILNQHFTKEQFYTQFGQGSTFPQVIMDDKNLGGCVDSIKYLHEQGII